MRDIWEEIKGFFTRDWTMTEKILVILCCILLGAIKGFMWAPVKRGINVGNRSVHNYGYDEEYWLDDED